MFKKPKTFNAEAQLQAIGVDYVPTEGAVNLNGAYEAHREILFQVIDSGAKLKVPVEITPELAAAFLQRNGSNIRNMNRARVRDTLAPDVASGKWVPYNACIAFDSTGQLKNGQHTCQAVVDGGAPIIAWVQTGISRAQEMVIDNCSPRQAFHAIEGMDRNGQGVLKAVLEHAQNQRSISNHGLQEHWSDYGKDITELLTMRAAFDGKPDDAVFHAALVVAMRSGVTGSDLRSFLNEMFGETTWIQASNFRNVLSKNHYSGYSAKAKARKFKLTLMVLGNYLDGDEDGSPPRVDAVDKYEPSERWNISA